MYRYTFLCHGCEGLSEPHTATVRRPLDLTSLSLTFSPSHPLSTRPTRGCERTHTCRAIYYYYYCYYFLFYSLLGFPSPPARPSQQEDLLFWPRKISGPGPTQTLSIPTLRLFCLGQININTAGDVPPLASLPALLFSPRGANRHFATPAAAIAKDCVWSPHQIVCNALKDITLTFSRNRPGHRQRWIARTNESVEHKNPNPTHR